MLSLSKHQAQYRIQEVAVTRIESSDCMVECNWQIFKHFDKLSVTEVEIRHVVEHFDKLSVTDAEKLHNLQRHLILKIL